MIAAVLVLALSTCGGCCRQANEFSFQKWEKRHKFEKKVSYVKYPGKRKIKISY